MGLSEAGTSGGGSGSSLGKSTTFSGSSGWTSSNSSGPGSGSGLEGWGGRWGSLPVGKSTTRPGLRPGGVLRALLGMMGKGMVSSLRTRRGGVLSLNSSMMSSREKSCSWPPSVP